MFTITTVPFIRICAMHPPYTPLPPTGALPTKIGSARTHTAKALAGSFIIVTQIKKESSRFGPIHSHSTMPFMHTRSSFRLLLLNNHILVTHTER